MFMYALTLLLADGVLVDDFSDLDRYNTNNLNALGYYTDDDDTLEDGYIPAASGGQDNNPQGNHLDRVSGGYLHLVFNPPQDDPEYGSYIDTPGNFENNGCYWYTVVSGSNSGTDYSAYDGIHIKLKKDPNGKSGDFQIMVEAPKGTKSNKVSISAPDDETEIVVTWDQLGADPSQLYSIALLIPTPSLSAGSEADVRIYIDYISIGPYSGGGSGNAGGNTGGSGNDSGSSSGGGETSSATATEEYDILTPSSRVLSPNGDGKNDVLSFEPADNVDVKKVVITDELGRTIKVLKGNDLSWDGKDAKGNDVPSGIYYYIADTSDGVAKGSVFVIRRKK